MHPVEPATHATTAGLPLALVVAGAPLLLAPIAYVLAARRQSVRGGWSRWRTASFVAGSGAALAALSPMMSALAHGDLRWHMAQHVLLGMLAPLALVLAAPVSLALRSMPARHGRRLAAALRHRVMHRLAHPAAALVLDTGALYALFLTPMFAATLADARLHALVQLHFLAAGCLFSWSIVGPDPAPRRPGMRTRLTVLALAIAAHSTLAKLMYAYGWPRGTSHDAEQIRAAAQVMYYGGDAAELLLLLALFTVWYRRPRRARARTDASSPPLRPVTARA